MRHLACALLASAAALAGCAGGPAKPAAASGALAAPRPQVMSAAGLGGIIGMPADALIRRFGAARIDLAEGDVRKLQFAGSACVLDIYLYPPAAGALPAATHVEARLRQGGAAVPPGDCIREIEAR